MMVRIQVVGPITDAYLYAGHLFAVFRDATLRCVSLNALFQSLRKVVGDLDSILEYALLRNDWLASEQTKTLLRDPSIRQAFRDRWLALSQKTLAIQESELRDHWKTLMSMDSMPVHDIRLYGMRVFLSHRAGVDELMIDSSESAGVRARGEPRRVFDMRSLEVSPRWGGVAISADANGLFHGNITDEDKQLRVNPKPVQNKSIRCTWTNFDVINYESRSSFSYLHNDHESVEKRPVAFAPDDNVERKFRISSFGKRARPDAEFLGPSVSANDVVYAYNSNNRFFIMQKDGQLLSGNIMSDARHREHLSRSVTKLGNIGSVFEKPPLSFAPSSVVVNRVGSHLEFFDRTVLLSNGQPTVLHRGPAYVVRVFPASRRFQTTSLVVDKEGAHLYAMLPEDTPKAPATSI